MKNSKIIRIALISAVVVLTYFIYESISKPIRFEKEKKKRYDKVIQRLKDIRTTELAFKTVNGKFSDNFDTLITFLKDGKFQVIKKIGSADDSSAVLVRDTLYISVKDSLFGADYAFDSLSFIPFGAGEKYMLKAGEIEKGKVKVKVFEAFASNEIIFKDMDITNYLKKSDGLKVGSMTEPSTNGNWE